MNNQLYTIESPIPEGKTYSAGDAWMVDFDEGFAIVEVLADTPLYRKVWKLKAKCWHTGSYASHDQGCHEQRYEQVWPQEDVDE